MSDIILNSTIKCPECGFEKEEVMNENSCAWFYDCAGCGKLLQPKPGDCCVFCSYGDVKCPPVQRSGKCCS
ncbi:MAG: hypothetical protein JSS91_06640 [Bacteroidetes bacterium]|nr:hypothetical protein [Bacteroidota bacterium]